MQAGNASCSYLYYTIVFQLCQDFVILYLPNQYSRGSPDYLFSSLRDVLQRRKPALTRLTGLLVLPPSVVEIPKRRKPAHAAESGAGIGSFWVRRGLFSKARFVSWSITITYIYHFIKCIHIAYHNMVLTSWSLP